jgi:hypothetical protein
MEVYFPVQVGSGADSKKGGIAGHYWQVGFFPLRCQAVPPELCLKQDKRFPAFMTECHGDHYNEQLLSYTFYPLYPFLGGKPGDRVKIFPEPFIGVEDYFITGTDI